MSQKHIIGGVLGLVGIGLMFVFVYQQFRTPASTGLPKTQVSERAPKAPEPETIDDVVLSIQGEASADLSALDEEENGEMTDIRTDSDSVTNLSTSYDEKSM